MVCSYVPKLVQSCRFIQSCYIAYGYRKYTKFMPQHGSVRCLQIYSAEEQPEEPALDKHVKQLAGNHGIYR